MSEKSMNEKNERNLDSTVDEIMEEIREQNVSEVKDINEKEQKSEERPRKKKVTKTKRPSGHHVSGDGVDHKAASDEDRPVKKKAPRRKKKVVREETGLLDLDGAEEWRDEEETAVPPVIKSADILSSGDAEAFNPMRKKFLMILSLMKKRKSCIEELNGRKSKAQKSPVKWLKL